MEQGRRQGSERADQKTAEGKGTVFILRQEGIGCNGVINKKRRPAGEIARQGISFSVE